MESKSKRDTKSKPRNHDRSAITKSKKGYFSKLFGLLGDSFLAKYILYNIYIIVPGRETQAHALCRCTNAFPDSTRYVT